MIRYGFVIAINAADIAEYRRLHAAVWPDVLTQIRRSNIRNYTIFLRQPENLLFATYEYHGSDHEADMRATADDPRTQAWWALCMPMQQPLATRAEGEWWAAMEEVFHVD